MARHNINVTLSGERISYAHLQSAAVSDQVSVFRPDAQKRLCCLLSLKEQFEGVFLMSPESDKPKYVPGLLLSVLNQELVITSMHLFLICIFSKCVSNKNK